MDVCRVDKRAVWVPVGLSITLFALSGVLVGFSGAWRIGVGGIQGLAPIFLAAVGVFFSAKAIRDAAIAKHSSATTVGILALLANHAIMTLYGGLIVWIATFQFTRGRQLRRFGRVLLPALSSGDAWARSSERPRFVEALDPKTREAIAAQWRENWRTEHASVAAFARLTLDLIALGAPPRLVACANEDSLDEIRHAEWCFALARSIDGRAESPAPFAEAQRARTLPGTRSLALAALAVDSLVDGALHEGVSARIIAKLARRTEDPVVRSILKRIAADEGRHARHGWDVVVWCLAGGGAVVASALEGALARLPVAMASAIPAGARAGAWERYGLIGAELEAAEYAAARLDVVARVRTLLASQRAQESAGDLAHALEERVDFGGRVEDVSARAYGPRKVRARVEDVGAVEAR
jgi:hypothetical protein